MIHNDIMLDELTQLRADLAVTVNRLWSIRISLAKVYARGATPSDFLSRRLNMRRDEEERRCSCLLDDLEAWVTESPQSDLSPQVQRVIRYIRNAYASHPLRQTLTRLLAAH